MANRDSGMIIGTRQKAIGMADLVAPTEGPDLIYGTPLDDVIAGLAGDDVIYGVEGDDSLDGNEDNDSLEGGPGNDTLDGGEGDDTLRGGEDDDWLIFSAGADVVDGGAGTDTFDLTGVTANVGMSLTYQWLELDGIGTGVVPSNLETILLGPGDDSVSANTDLDTKLDGGEGNDRLLGLEGNDTLIAGPGLDDLDGNQGDDLLVPGPGRDLLVGGRGTDTLDYSATTLGFTLDINPGPAPLGGLLYWSIVSSPDPIAEIDQVRGVDFEVILGGAGDDHITAFQTGVTLRGMAGNDTLTGDSGSDFIEGGPGADVMDGGSGGDDTLYGDSSTDLIYGGLDNDLIAFGALEIRMKARTVHVKTEHVPVSPKEFELITYFARNAGQVVTRMQLLEHVWKLHFDPQTNVVDVHVGRLRRKLEAAAGRPVIHTARGEGYIFDPGRGVS